MEEVSLWIVDSFDQKGTKEGPELDGVDTGVASASYSSRRAVLKHDGRSQALMKCWLKLVDA